MSKRSPFKLEALKYQPKDSRTETLLYSKAVYCPKVKVTDWHYDLENQPVDSNPYDPESYRLHTSHYKRLGYCGVVCPISETRDALRKGIVSDTVLGPRLNKKVVNLESFNNVFKNKMRPKICEEYITTMQSSYESPEPYKMKKLEMPETGNQNKKFAMRPESIFADDNEQCYFLTIQKVKGFRHVSFNPCTGTYTDGSIR